MVEFARSYRYAESCPTLRIGLGPCSRPYGIWLWPSNDRQCDDFSLANGGSELNSLITEKQTDMFWSLIVGNLTNLPKLINKKNNKSNASECYWTFWGLKRDMSKIQLTRFITNCLRKYVGLFKSIEDEAMQWKKSIVRLVAV